MQRFYVSCFVSLQEPGLGNANVNGTTQEKTLLVEGSEGYLIIEFASKYNCTLDIVALDANYYFNVYENGSAVGLLGMVAERKVDVSFSGLYV